MRQPTALLGLALDAAPDVAAAAHVVVDHLFPQEHLLPAVYIERGGRLRCVAAGGRWHVRDGLDPSSGAIGRAFSTETETVMHTEARVPLTVGDRTVGVLDVASRVPLHSDDLELLRACAAALGRRIEQLGGLPEPTPEQRLVAHLADLTAREEGEAIVTGMLEAAGDLVPLHSALLIRATDHGLVAARTSGPLSVELAAAPLELIAGWVRDATSCFTVDAPAMPALRHAGIKTLVAVALVARDDALGVLVLADDRAVPVDTDDVELLEQLAAHAALCLRNAELVGSLRDRAASDPLTGLGHHATFHEALATSHRRPRTAVVLCDLDGFKRLNDTHGHAHGDRILCGVADAMTGALRRGDRLFRVGGDEFAALLAVGSGDEALDAAHRLRAAVHEARLGVTISVGVAVPRNGESDALLLARADRALYSVKAGGRDGVALADE